MATAPSAPGIAAGAAASAADSPGHLGRVSAESQPWFETPRRPPPGSPNILFVVFDDVGYADFGCFGSEIRTPQIDRVAAAGLRYSNFHTTTLCSPTRACLLTGRNHHSVGMRYLSNYDMGWPSGRGSISPSAATLAEMLREHGYATYAVGKWHLAPTDQTSAAGPFDHWPLARGFDRFYGFMNGGTDQFHPELVEDNHVVVPPASPGYHLSADLVDHAIAMLANQLSLRPETPFFMNLAFGAGHWPHQVAPEWIGGYDGVFDAGWDRVREVRLARQKAFGLVPASTTLPPSNPGVADWNTLDADQRRVALRLQQAYAGALEFADAQFGRLLDFLARTGRLDDTLIVLLSDNGASTDCEPQGTTNILRWFNGLPETTAAQLAGLADVGGPRSASNYPWGWAQASNTPARLYKGHTHGGGVRDPLVVAWPRRIVAGGGLRHQFVHAIDVVPTVLELCGIAAPALYRGVPQLPVHGTSFAYSFDHPDAPARKQTQYFEMYGHRGIWHRGWKAVTCHTPGDDFDRERWELYRLDDDFAETRDLAHEHPDVLRELIERWWAEAGRYGVLPLDDRRDLLFRPQPRPGSIRAQRRFVLHPGIAPVPAEAAPLLADLSHRIEVDLEMASDDEAGMLIAFGSVLGGWALLVDDGRLCYVYNRCGELLELRSGRVLQAGTHRVAFEFRRTAPLCGTGRLLVDGADAGEARFDGLLRRPTLANLHIGRGGLPSLMPSRNDDWPFSGRIHEVRIEHADDAGEPVPFQEVD